MRSTRRRPSAAPSSGATPAQAASAPTEGGRPGRGGRRAGGRRRTIGRGRPTSGTGAGRPWSPDDRHSGAGAGRCRRPGGLRNASGPPAGAVLPADRFSTETYAGQRRPPAHPNGRRAGRDGSSGAPSSAGTHDGRSWGRPPGSRGAVPRTGPDIPFRRSADRRKPPSRAAARSLGARTAGNSPHRHRFGARYRQQRGSSEGPEAPPGRRAPRGRSGRQPPTCRRGPGAPPVRRRGRS